MSIIRHSFLCFLTALLYCSATLATLAQRVQVSGATRAAVGEPVRIQYSIAHLDVQLTAAPTIQGSDVELVSGPNISKRSVMVSGNGKRTGSESTTISFTYIADKPTKVTLTPAVFEVAGKRVQAPSHTIQFTGSANAKPSPQNTPTAAPSGKRGANSVIIRTLTNKRSVYEQEPILLSYRVLSPVDIASLTGGLPSLKAFLRHDIPLPQDKQVTAENINGKLYRSVLWAQHVLFPQQTGQLVIPSYAIQGVLQEVDRTIDPLEAFFNGGNALITTPFSKNTEAVTIHVKPLPSNKPSDFSGGVGQFSMQVLPPAATPRTNEAYRLQIVINGLGNHKLITPPKVAFPKSFQTFEPKSTVQTALTPEGLQGSITFDYIAVPKAAGTFTIPEITFVYFDTQQGQFRTLRHKGFTLAVAQGSTSAKASEPLPNDIAPLRLEAGRTLTLADSTIDTASFILTLLGIIACFAVLYFVLRKQIAARSNVTLRRQAKAFKQATQALRALPTADHTAFYATMSQVLHTYMVHRFAAEQQVLSEAQTHSLLAQHHITPELIARYTALIDRCQQAAYAGQSSAHSLEAERTEALALLQQIEQTHHA